MSGLSHLYDKYSLLGIMCESCITTILTIYIENI